MKKMLFTFRTAQVRSLLEIHYKNLSAPEEKCLLAENLLHLIPQNSRDKVVLCRRMYTMKSCYSHRIEENKTGMNGQSDAAW